MAWTTATAGVTTAGGSAVTSLISQRDTSRMGDANTSSNSYSIVGMDMNKVPEVEEAIRQYIERVNKTIGGVESYADPKNAFRGNEIEDAVKAYVNAVKSYTQTVVSKLVKFNEELEEAQKQWNASVSSFANEIKSSTANLHSVVGDMGPTPTGGAGATGGAGGVGAGTTYSATM